MTTVLEGIQWQPFRNDSSEAVPPFSLMRVTGTATNNGQQIITIDKPNTTFQRFYAVNANNTVASGSYGKCTFGPSLTIAYDTSATPAVLEGWGAKPSEWTAFPNRQGFTIFGVLSDTHSGMNLAYAMQEPIKMVRAKATENISAGSTGTADVHFNAGASDFDDITVSNVWTDNGEQITSGKEAVFGWFEDEGVWSLLERDCE